MVENVPATVPKAPLFSVNVAVNCPEFVMEPDIVAFSLDELLSVADPVKLLPFCRIVTEVNPVKVPLSVLALQPDLTEVSFP